MRVASKMLALEKFVVEECKNSQFIKPFRISYVQVRIRCTILNTLYSVILTGNTIMLSETVDMRSRSNNWI